MNNRRQMYYTRYSGARNVPNVDNSSVPAPAPNPVSEPVSVTSNNSTVDCTSCNGCPTPYGNRVPKTNSRCNECIRVNDMPGFALAMAYVPWQTFRNLYDEHEALCNGTIFKELDLDFRGRRCN